MGNTQRLSYGIPNLLGGVSQQTSELRLANQVSNMENMSIDAANGCITRPGTSHVDDLDIGGDLSKARFHFIRRDENEKYLLGINTLGDIIAYDLESESILPVEDNTTDASVYINSGGNNPIDNLRLKTVGDSTFLVNRTVEVAMDDTQVSPDPTDEGLVQITRGLWNLTYSIRVDFEDGTYVTSSVSTGDPTSGSSPNYKTTVIAADLVTGFASTPITASAIDGSDTIHLLNTYASPIVKITTNDSYGGGANKTAFRYVEGRDNLPAKGVDGLVIKIVEDDSDITYEYYLKWVEEEVLADSGDAVDTNGLWRETTGWGVETTIDTETMPLELKREPDAPLRFSINYGEWGDRLVGDEDSCPKPSFVGGTIQNLFYHRNRLGLLSGENVIMTRTSLPKDFFNESARTLYDTDPIDVAASTSDVNNLKSALTLQGGLIIIGENKQLILGSSGALSPKTVTLDVTTSYVAEDVDPIGINAYGYLAVQRGSYTTVREYQIDNLSATSVAPDITKHVDSYIEGTANTMVAASAYNTMFMLTESEGARVGDIVIYQWYESGGSRVQSSWCKWNFGDDMRILGMTAFDKDAWLIIGRPDDDDGDCALVKMDLSNSLVGSMPYRPAMDFMSDVPTVDYEPSTNISTIYVQDTKKAGLEPYILLKEPISDLLAGDNISNIVWNDSFTEGTVFGDFSTASLLYGYPLNVNITFSPIYVRANAGDGYAIDDQTVIDGRLQLLTGRLVFKDSGEFTVEVDTSAKGGQVYRYTNAGEIGDPELMVGEPYLNSGFMSFPILSKNDEVEIRCLTDKFFPISIQKLEWTGSFTMISQRI